MGSTSRVHERRKARARKAQGSASGAVAQLRAFQALTEAVLAHSSDLVVFFDPDGTIDWVSPSVLKAFGIEPEVLVGLNCFDLVHPADRAQASLDFASILDLGDSVLTEFRIEFDGTMHWVEGVFTNLLDEPDVGRIVGNLRDVTERKEAAEALLFHGTLLAAVGEAVVAVDNGGHILYWNDAAEALYGWSAEVAVGQRFDLLVPTAPGWEVPAADEILGGRSWSGELRVVARSGQVVPIMSTARPVLGFDGELIATTVVSIDLTEQLRQRQKDDEARRRLLEAQESARLGSFEIDLSTGEVTRSPELWRIIGHEPGSIEGVDLEHVHPDDRADVEAALQAAADGLPDISCTHRVVRADGTVRWVLSRTRATGLPVGTVLSGTMQDITERHQAELALAHQATHDPLTGLANRRKLLADLERSISSRATATTTAVISCDLDHFKTVNDRLGQVTADEVLRAVGGRLRNLIQPGDTMARPGGDEFVICCREVRDRDDLIRRAERLQLALLEPVVLGGDAIELSASIGAAASRPGSSAEDLLREADAALHEAKQRGGSHLVVFDEALQAEVARRQQLIAEIDGALRSGQFQTYFQPEVALSTGTLLGFEALARWHHPVHGLVPPTEFIELAERSRMIGRLGRMVLRDACTALARWIDECPEQRLTVALNVSPIQLADPSFPRHVRDAIAEAGVPPGRVCLEVTESSLMDAEVATRALRELKATGVSIAIDDFGTGYSSLARLKRFPVDLLKIDRTFVDGLGSDPEDEVIVATVIELARSLGLDVVAEGVETEAQLELLAQLGCERGQGYLWSPALPLAGATAYAAGQDTLLHAQPSVEDHSAARGQTRAEDHAATSTMAAIVHELATPLTVIRGYADLARYLPAPDDGQMLDVALGAIGRSADDIATIMQTMTDVRSIEEGTLVLAREPLDIVRLLSEIIAERAMAETSTPISLRDDDPVEVIGDATRCRQIFINLLANAATWSPEGAAVEIVVEVGSSTASISVIDQGPGVHADRVGDLFRMFARPDRSRKGTGLGLYVARSLARGQGGDIRYRRAEGGGSEFIVDLPLLPTER